MPISTQNHTDDRRELWPLTRGRLFSPAEEMEIVETTVRDCYRYLVVLRCELKR